MRTALQVSHGEAAYAGAEQSTVVLVALLVTLIPTTIGALLSGSGSRAGLLVPWLARTQVPAPEPS